MTGWRNKYWSFPSSLATACWTCGTRPPTAGRPVPVSLKATSAISRDGENGAYLPHASVPFIHMRHNRFDTVLPELADRLDTVPSSNQREDPLMALDRYRSLQAISRMEAARQDTASGSIGRPLLLISISSIRSVIVAAVFYKEAATGTVASRRTDGSTIKASGGSRPSRLRLFALC
jgi:hypothetical protein